MNILTTLQIIVGLSLTLVILIQSEGNGLSPTISAGQFYGTKRGIEKIVFGLTIGLSLSFLGLSLAAYVIWKWQKKLELFSG